MDHRFFPAVILTLASAASQASLLGRSPLTPGGTDYQAYYDTALNITWLADANAAAGSDYLVVPNSTTDFRITWTSAQAWIASLNANSYLGANNWRLPAMVDTGAPGCDGNPYSGSDCGHNVQTISGSTVYSEMAHLYYVTLGNVAGYTTSGVERPCNETDPSYCLSNAGPFSNLQPQYYWSSTVYALASHPNMAWSFGFVDGYQGAFDYPYGHRAWAVLDGDIAPVPTPAAVWLFGGALGALGVLKRRVS